MGSIPVLKPKDVAAILVRLGFEEVRQRGSHKQFRHPDGRFTTLPYHAYPVKFMCSMKGAAYFTGTNKTIQTNKTVFAVYL